MTEAIERELEEHGGREYVVDRIEDPDWSEDAGALRDWRRCVPAVIQCEWSSLSVEARVVAYLVAASHEDLCD
jgi:hypothetical protein